MQPIVVGVDFSDATDKVVQTSERLARKLNTSLVLVHVAAPEPDFVTYEPGPQHERDWRAAEIRKEHRSLNVMAERLTAGGVPTQGRLVEGSQIDRLLGEADRLGAEMIVVGSRGHSRIYEMVVGSVAEGLLRRSTIPVLIIPVGADKDAARDAAD